jgi:uncharacterized damage-inducible protein DinB
MSMTWTDLIRCSIDDAYKASDNLMAMVKDDELGWKPATGTNWMTVGQLLKHTTEACGLCCKGFVTGDWGQPEGMDMSEMPPESMMPPAEKLPAVASVGEARKLLAADKAVALAMLAQAGEANLESQLTTAPWEPGAAKPLGQHLFGMVMHLNQHKGQLFYYLKLMGRDVNTMHLWGV